MTPTELLEQACLDAVADRLQLFDSAPGKCLRVTRELIQAALNIDYNAFYGLVTERVADNATDTPWARDVQLSLRNLGYAVPWDERSGGMLCFDAGLALEGHVGVLVGRHHLFENTASQRGVLISGYNRLSHISEWRAPEKLEVFALPWAPM